MFFFFNVLLGLMSLTNLISIARGQSPSIRQITSVMAASGDGASQLKVALGFAALVQVYLISLVYPLKAIDHYVGLGWSLLMLLSVLETVYTGRKMAAVASGEDTSGQFPVHDSPWYTAYQIGYNLAVVGVCLLLILPR